VPASDAILDRLIRLHPKVIDLSLGRIERLLAALGHPERALPPVVHVAGTNGKGSVIATLRAILEAAGYRAHTYTSPHLVRFNERIRLGGRLIDDAGLAATLEECEVANAGAAITFFEITTAAAMLAFARHAADVLLLEAGLGGRLDATNVIPAPALTAITPVSLDHQQYLGDRLEDIAAEKAAIIKPGIACVSGRQPAVARAVVEARARAVGAPLLAFDAEWTVRPEGDGLAYASPQGCLTLPRPALAGPHQIDNAGMAVACVGRLDGFRVPPAAIVQGLASVVWPGRLQHLRSGVLARRLGAGWQLWLDGGHNPAAGDALAAVAAGEWRDRPLHLVVGMLKAKDPAGFLAPLAAHAASVTALAIPGEESSLPPAAIAGAARGLGLRATEAATIAEALERLAGRERAPGRALVCGSLYLVGRALAAEDATVPA
jgi:dihydrofolate synthase/folylpolyglutamate synthase